MNDRATFRAGNTSMSASFEDTDEDLEIYEALIDPNGEGGSGKGKGAGGAPMMMPPGMMGGGGSGAGAGGAAGGLGAGKAGMGASAMGGGSIGPNAAGGGGLRADGLGSGAGGTRAAGLDSGSGVKGDLDGDGIPDDLDGDGIPDRPGGRSGLDLGDRAGAPDLNRNRDLGLDSDRSRLGLDDRLGRDGSGLDRPGIDKPGIDKPGIDKPGIDKPGIDKPGIDKPGLDTPKLDTPKMDAPGGAGGGMPGGGGGGMPGGGGGGMPGGGGGTGQAVDVKVSLEQLKADAKLWRDFAEAFKRIGGNLAAVELKKEEFGYADQMSDGYNKVQDKVDLWVADGEKTFNDVAERLEKTAKKYEGQEQENSAIANNTKKK